MAALLVPAVEPLLLLSEATVPEVPVVVVPVAAVLAVVVAELLPLAAVGVVVVVVPLLPFVLVAAAVGAPGTRPSWLSAEKMLSMKPIMPPLAEDWPLCPLWPSSPSLSLPVRRLPCAWCACPVACVVCV